MEKVLIALTEEESDAGCNKDAAWVPGEKMATQLTSEYISMFTKISTS